MINFVAIVKKFLEKKIDEGKIKMNLSSDGQSRMRQVERDLASKKIDIDQAIELLYKEREYRIDIGSKSDREDLRKMFR